MHKHSRALGRLAKENRKPLSAVKRKRHSREQNIPDQWIDLATDAIRDGHTTVDTFVGPFHPDVRFIAFRAYVAALFTFMQR
jgi:hypothetical protein